MPTVSDKAIDFSSRRHRSSFRSSKPATQKLNLRKCVTGYFPRESCFKKRLSQGRMDLFTAGEDQTPRPIIKLSGETKPSLGQTSADNSSETESKRRSGSQSKEEESGGECGITNISNFVVDFVHDETDNKNNTPLHTLSTSEYLERQIQQSLRRRKKEIVDRLMATLLECIDDKLEAAFAPLVDGDRSPGQSQSSGDGTMLKPLEKSTSRKRQLQRDHHPNEEEGEEKDEKKNRANKRAKRENTDDFVLFACPYYKYAPDQFKTRRTCCGPGFKLIHRLKEHLSRAHRLPKFQCNRCFEFFDHDDELKKHQRAAEPCSVKTENRDLADGFDQDQEEKLKKKSTKNSHEKWKEWYCILFNKDQESGDIPSPYHGESKESGLRAPSSQESYQRVCDNLCQRLKPLLRANVEDQVDKFLLGSETRIRNKVLQAIQTIPNLIEQLLQSMQPPLEGNANDQNTTQNPAGPNPFWLNPDSTAMDMLNSIPWHEQDLGFNLEDQGEDIEPNLDTLEDGPFDDFYGPSLASETSQSRRSSGSSLGYLDAQFPPIEDFEDLSKAQGYGIHPPDDARV